jgi:hypothetical protein
MSEKRKRSIGPYLNTAGRVTAEMGRIYRAYKRGEICQEQYTAMNNGLAKMSEGMVEGELMRRLESIKNSKQSSFVSAPLLKAVSK